ncbi:MAG: type IV pilus modification PilV family protein [Methylobacter sp.]
MKKILRRKLKGFSLIEVMIASVVVALAMLGVARLQGITLQDSADSRMKTHALNLAQDKIEELRNFANQSTYSGYSGSDNNTAVGANSNFTRTWTITDCANSVNCKQVNVGVTWTDPNNSTQTVQLTSYIAESDPVKSGVVLLAATTPSPSPTPTPTPTPTPFVGGNASQPITTWTGTNPKTITWSAITGATQYKIYSCTMNNNNSLTSCLPTTLVGASGSTSYAPGDPGHKNTTCVKVVASDGSSDSTASSVMCSYQKSGNYSYSP